MKVYNLGSLNIDYVYSVEHFVTAGETLSSNEMNIFPGGKGLNQSVALAKAGVDVIHGAVVGKNGDFLLDALKSSGVNTDRILKTNADSGHTIIQVDKNGQNCILLFPGTNYSVTDEYIDTFLSDANEKDILLLQNEINNIEYIFEVAHSKKMQIAFNPSPFNSDIKKLPLSYVKWFFCNEIEGKELFGSVDPEEICKRFSHDFPDSSLILTLGANGSIFANRDIRINQSIYKTQVIDTTAAGDSYTGYFIAEIIKGKEISSALDTAAKASSVTVSRKGASSSIPLYHELTGE